MQSFLKVSVPFPGILFLNIAMLTRSQKRKFVSVPFPGILFLNKRSNILMAVPPSCFRPLPGDLISQFPPTAKRCATCFVFPSPSRGSYFSMESPIDIVLWRYTVSVPFPGILFLNPVLYMPDLNWIPKPNCGAKPNPTLE